MKVLFLIIALFNIQGFLFSQNKNYKEIANKIPCNVIKIDSIENFYLIDVFSKNDKYKLISKKNKSACSNIYIGGLYYFTIHQTAQELVNKQYVDNEFYIKIDWGSNLYIVDELCGLCYETDTSNNYLCKQINEQEAKLEAILTKVFFNYYKNDQKKSIEDFKTQIKENTTPFTLTGGRFIPIYSSPIKSEINYLLFNDTINQKVFYGKVFYQYKNYYLIQGYYNSNFDIQILGWIDKRQLIHKLNFKNKN